MIGDTSASPKAQTVRPAMFLTQVGQGFKVRHLPPLVDDPAHDLHEPRAAFAAGTALAAGLVIEKLHQPQARPTPCRCPLP